jgi:hypothetical protein
LDVSVQPTALMTSHSLGRTPVVHGNSQNVENGVA